MARKSKFFKRINGADDIYLTKKSIAVRNVYTYQDSKGNFKLKDNTRYYKKTKSRISYLTKKFGYVRKGRNCNDLIVNR